MYFDDSQYNQEHDPFAPNYGRAKRGQLVQNNTKDLRQSPMVAGLNQPVQAPQAQGPVSQPAAKPAPIAGATGTFGPKTFTQNLQTRGQTDFTKGLSANPHKAGRNLINAVSQAANKFPGGPVFGIGRRAKGSEHDYSVENATTALQRAYQQLLGRQASPEEIQAQLAGQGLKPGDRWVGQSGLNSVLQSLIDSDEAKAYAASTNETSPQESGSKNIAEGQAAVYEALAGAPTHSPLQASLGVPAGSGAEQAYQEYLSEFGPDDIEVPISYEEFAQFYNQAGFGGPQQTQAWDPTFYTENENGRFGWNNMNLNPVVQAGGSRFEGFNDERALAGGDSKSVKDAFRRIVGGLGIDLSQYKTFDEVENMLRTQVAPVLQANNVNVLDVQKDKILVDTMERGPMWIDVVGDATGDDPRWWWGAEDTLGDSGNMATAGGTAINPWDYLSASRESRSSSSNEPTQQSALLAALGMDGNWKSLLEQLMAQAQG